MTSASSSIFKQNSLIFLFTLFIMSGCQSNAKNVLGGELQPCCTKPMTGFYRDGYCRTDEHDHGVHVVCAKVTREFLEFSKSRGNDLITPSPGNSFPGLKDGDKWCLCAGRWREAYEAGVAPPIILESTHEKALQTININILKEYAAN
jgi:uncharacterized protein (DUF2237 family)